MRRGLRWSNLWLPGLSFLLLNLSSLLNMYLKCNRQVRMWNLPPPQYIRSVFCMRWESRMFTVWPDALTHSQPFPYSSLLYVRRSQSHHWFSSRSRVSEVFVMRFIKGKMSLIYTDLCFRAAVWNVTSVKCQVTVETGHPKPITMMNVSLVAKWAVPPLINEMRKEWAVTAPWRPDW